MKEQIAQIAGLATGLQDEKNKTPFLGSAVSALKCAADNLQWHAEEIARRASAAAPPAGGSAPAAKPPAT